MTSACIDKNSIGIDSIMHVCMQCLRQSREVRDMKEHGIIHSRVRIIRKLHEYILTPQGHVFCYIIMMSCMQSLCSIPQERGSFYKRLQIITGFIILIFLIN
jgi:hypothetical protein